MREFLEFHDSELVAVVRTDEGLRLELLGYIHRWSNGRGTGWTFPIEIVLTGGAGAVASQLPIEIGDGAVSVDEIEILGMVELPFDRAGDCRVTIQTVDGGTHVLTGSQIRIDRGSDGTFIEMLPAEFNPDVAG
jgi:hypothetical protein